MAASSARDRDRAEESRIRAAYSARVNHARYSLFNPAQLWLTQEREAAMLALLARSGRSRLDDQRLLEVGCGTGFWLREFIKWGARPSNIAGIDLLPERIAEAKTLCPAEVRLVCGGATEIGFPDASFDLVLQSTVFTSILDPAMKQRIAAEMLRVLKQDGLILWYDYHVNNPWNPDVRGVTKREIHDLFPGCRIQLRRITLVPQLARLAARGSRLVCWLLGSVPLLRTHYLGTIRKVGA